MFAYQYYHIQHVLYTYWDYYPEQCLRRKHERISVNNLRVRFISLVKGLDKLQSLEIINFLVITDLQFFN